MEYRFESHGLIGAQQNMIFIGWGVVGEPQEGVIVRGPGGRSIDVTGYDTADYWDGDTFRGPDIYGIVPVYERADGSQFPADARLYPHLA